MGESKIEWTEMTWNPVTGCTKVSKGCQNCYAERMAKRLKAMRNPSYENGFELTLHSNLLPFKWKKPRIVFVNSMSDLFHEDIPINFIKQVFDIMNKTPQHTYQVLTKRSARLINLSSNLDWTENIWMGVTVESEEYISRIEDLSNTDAKVKFLSLEPLLSAIPHMNLDKIDWAIVGGESGPGARPMLKKWVLEIKEQCENYQVPFFFKQWGGTNKKKAGRILLGQTWDEMPLIEAVI